MSSIIKTSNKLLLLLIPLLAFVFLQNAYPASPVSPTTPVNNQTIFSNTRILDTDHTTWGLDKDDWNKYLVLMNGEAGLYYAHLEPSFLLALYEKDLGTRERYLELAVRRDKSRIDELFQFNRDFKRVREKLFPDEPAIDEVLFKQRMAYLNQKHERLNRDKSNDSEPIGYSALPRSKIYVKIFDCDACDNQIKKLVKNKSLFDVFVLDSRNNQDIQTWAKRLRLPIGQVNTGRITINFDDGSYHALNTDKVPFILKGES